VGHRQKNIIISDVEFVHLRSVSVASLSKRFDRTKCLLTRWNLPIILKRTTRPIHQSITGFFVISSLLTNERTSQSTDFSIVGVADIVIGILIEIVIRILHGKITSDACNDFLDMCTRKGKGFVAFGSEGVCLLSVVVVAVSAFFSRQGRVMVLEIVGIDVPAFAFGFHRTAHALQQRRSRATDRASRA